MMLQCTFFTFVQGLRVTDVIFKIHSISIRSTVWLAHFRQAVISVVAVDRRVMSMGFDMLCCHTIGYGIYINRSTVPTLCLYCSQGYELAYNFLPHSSSLWECFQCAVKSYDI